jgi:Flp pilus assembly CpaF family ATPase
MSNSTRNLVVEVRAVVDLLARLVEKSIHCLRSCFRPILLARLPLRHLRLHLLAAPNACKRRTMAKRRRPPRSRAMSR